MLWLESALEPTAATQNVREHDYLDKNEQQDHRKMNVRRIPLMSPQPTPNGEPIISQGLLACAYGDDDGHQRVSIFLWA
jgi:hypothetical protein